MSFWTALLLFLIGVAGLSLAIMGDFSSRWTLIFAGIGIGAWFTYAIWAFVERTFLVIHHLKRSWAIHKDMKAEQEIEKKQVVQRGGSEAKKKAAKRRVQLWIDTILGVRD